MKNLEKGLTRRSFLGNTLKTAGGILLGSSLSSCGFDDWGYTFDLSGLESDEFARLFIEAGQHYWGVGDRNDASINKAYFGYIPPKSDGSILAGEASWLPKRGDGDPLMGYDTIYTHNVIFNEDLSWANCNIEGERGEDFFNVAGHELGHSLYRMGNEMHSDDPTNIMYPNTPQRCIPAQ